jgi:hypothetical protein
MSSPFLSHKWKKSQELSHPRIHQLDPEAWRLATTYYEKNNSGTKELLGRSINKSQTQEKAETCRWNLHEKLSNILGGLGT